MKKSGLTTFLLVLLLSGCGRGSPEYPDYLRLRLKDEPTSLDPARIVDVPGGALSAKIYDGLVRFNGEGKIVPDLASRWKISPDGRTYRFYLRPRVRFHNGRKVSAADVIYSFQRLLDPRVNSPRSWLLEAVRGAAKFSRGETKGVAGLRSKGDGAVEIELDHPSSLFLDFLAMPNAGVVPREEVEKWGRSFSDHPCGTGPFRLGEWKHNNRIVLAANPDYFGGRPGLAGIFYRVIPEDMTATVEFEQGNLDLLAVPRAEFRKYTTRSPWKERVKSRVGLNIYYLGFNCQKPPFDDPRIRRAFNHAIDRQKIIDSLLEGRAISAAGPVPPVLLPPPAGYEYNPGRSRELLAETGLKLPLRVKLLLKSDREVLSTAEVIQDYLRKVGIELTLVQREWSSFKEAINQGDFDLFYLSWWADYPDAENFLYPTFYSSNWGPEGNRARFRDVRVDELLRRARETVDPAAGLSLYASAQRRVVELAPWVFLWHKKEYVITSSRVEDYRIPMMYNGDKGMSIKLICGE